MTRGIDIITRIPSKLYRAMLDKKARVKVGNKKSEISCFYFRAKNIAHAKEQVGLVCSRLEIKLKKVVEVDPNNLPSKKVAYFPTLNERAAKIAYEEFQKIFD